MSGSLDARERALRALPPSYSLALRLRDAHVDTDVICEYPDVDRAAIDTFYQLAEAKLLVALQFPEPQ